MSRSSSFGFGMCYGGRSRRVDRCPPRQHGLTSDGRWRVVNSSTVTDGTRSTATNGCTRRTAGDQRRPISVAKVGAHPIVDDGIATTVAHC